MSRFHRHASPAMRVAAPLLAVALLTGCPVRRGGGTNPGAPDPLFTPAVARENLARARREAAERSGPQGRLAAAAAALWEELEGLATSDLPPETLRAREADAVARYAQAVARVARTLPAPGAGAVADTEVQVDLGDYFRVADLAASEGRYAEALLAAEALLQELDLLGEAPAFQGTVAFRMGLWHLALGHYGEAAAAFDAVAEARERAGELAERARLMGEEIDLLLTLPDGAVRDDLARGWALLEAGDLDGAERVGQAVVAGASDEHRSEGQILLDAARRARAARGASLASAALADLRDGPPFDTAREGIEALRRQGYAEDANRVARALEDAEVEAARARGEDLREAWETAVQRAEELMRRDEAAAAAALFEQFEGTAYEEEAGAEALRFVDAYVREERRRAGDLFVAAQAEPDVGERRRLLREARQILADLLQEHPGSSYADRVRANLVAVDQALGEMDDAPHR